jgi:hypothetical protein
MVPAAPKPSKSKAKPKPAAKKKASGEEAPATE